MCKEGNTKIVSESQLPLDTQHDFCNCKTSFLIPNSTTVLVIKNSYTEEYFVKAWTLTNWHLATNQIHFAYLPRTSPLNIMRLLDTPIWIILKILYLHRFQHIKILIFINNTTTRGGAIMHHFHLKMNYRCKREASFILILPSFACFALVLLEDGPVMGWNM